MQLIKNMTFVALIAIGAAGGLTITGAQAAPASPAECSRTWCNVHAKEKCREPNSVAQKRCIDEYIRSCTAKCAILLM